VPIGVDEPLEVVVEVRPGPLAPGLLGRALGAVAARCDLPLDRLDEALLAADALCDHALDDDPLAPLRVTVIGMAGQVWLRVGPLPEPRATALLDLPALPGGPALLPSLADGTTIAPDGDGHVAVLSFEARR
jgi:hypothetical protein